jgi:hypothetical protein
MENSNSLKLLVSRGGRIYRFRVIEQSSDPRVSQLLNTTPNDGRHFIGIMRVPPPPEFEEEYVHPDLVSIYSDSVWNLDQMNGPLDAYEELVRIIGGMP